MYRVARCYAHIFRHISYTKTLQRSRRIHRNCAFAHERSERVNQCREKVHLRRLNTVYLSNGWVLLLAHHASQLYERFKQRKTLRTYETQTVRGTFTKFIKHNIFQLSQVCEILLMFKVLFGCHLWTIFRDLIVQYWDRKCMKTICYCYLIA